MCLYYDFKRLLQNIKELQTKEAELTEQKHNLKVNCHKAEFNELKQRAVLQKMKDKLAKIENEVEVIE